MKKLIIYADMNMTHFGDALMHSFPSKEEANKAVKDPAFRHWYAGPNNIDIDDVLPQFQQLEVRMFSSLDEWKRVFVKNYEEEVRKEAIAKLTDEEIRVLGLRPVAKKK